MLRNRLEQISNTAIPEEHSAQIAALALEFPHTITPIYTPYILDSFTCLVHALGFTGEYDYMSIFILTSRDIFAGADFAHWLLDSRALTEISEVEAANEDLVFYFSDTGRFKHVGLLRQPGRVESKWGTQGLYEHPIFEVPESYGINVRYFAALPYEEAIELFYDYAEERGVQFEYEDN